MKIVIVGGGFAGVRAALSLSRDSNNDVVLISDKPCFEYHAALYRTSTGRSVLEVSVPLSKIFKDTDVDLAKDTAKTIDTQKQVVTGSSGHHYQYDRAILALGSVTSYFGIKGLAEYSYSLKNVSDAMELRQHLHQALTKGDVELNYVVVGGGPSGIELAAEMVAYLKLMRRRHHINKAFTVSLVEAAPRVLPSLSEKVSRLVSKRLRHLGIKVYTNTAVEAETASQLKLPEGSIKSHTVIWTAGVTGNPFFAANAASFKLAKSNRVEVDAHLQAAQNVYVIGDSAATPKAGWAQTAIYDANYVAERIAGEDIEYNPAQPIGAIPVGPKWCVVSDGKRVYWGYPGWLMRRWLDWSIFRSVLPLHLAIKTWVYGTKREETCRTCR